MSQEQIIQMLIKRMDDMEEKLEKHDTRLMHILVTIGKIQVRTAMVTGIFSTVGGAIAVIIAKYLLNF